MSDHHPAGHIAAPARRSAGCFSSDRPRHCADSPDPDGAVHEGGGAAAQPHSQAWRASLADVRVVDGDTLDVRIDDKIHPVRLIGVNTPEVHGQVECYSREAWDRTKALAPPGTPVRLEEDVSETGRYGRLLRYVYLPDGRMLNEVLVREGYAQVATYPPDVKYQDRFLEAQRQARERLPGCGGIARAEAQPRQRRQPCRSPRLRQRRVGVDAPSPSAETAPDASDQQNKRSRGELLDHVPGGQFYGRTVPEACFAPEADARAAGFRQSLRCFTTRRRSNDEGTVSQDRRTVLRAPTGPGRVARRPGRYGRRSRSGFATNAAALGLGAPSSPSRSAGGASRGACGAVSSGGVATPCTR